MSELTQILADIRKGDRQAADQLLPLVYDELRKLAACRLANENPGQTLQATALVHEAYLRLVNGNGAQPNWDGREHFFGAAAEAMRRILVDQARHKLSQRGGGGRKREALDENLPVTDDLFPDLLAVNEALERFEKIDKQKAELVKLRYFAGLTIPQAAGVLGISSSTADRYWSYARAWLHVELNRDAPQTDD